LQALLKGPMLAQRSACAYYEKPPIKRQQGGNIWPC